VIASERLRVRHGARAVVETEIAGRSVASIVILQLNRWVPIVNRFFGSRPWLDLPAYGTR
jgi:hypothetical protein